MFQFDDGDLTAARSLRVWLPVPATPFLGRQRELQRVVFLMRQHIRLLTLTGPGGTGRHGTSGRGRGIGSLPGRNLVGAARRCAILRFSSATGARGEGAARPRRRAGGKRALLLLDKSEHLLPAAAEEIAKLIATSGPALLVTSRERLQLQGEQVYPVPTLAERDGIELFLARARALEPAFAANESVSQLCLRLDNLPLALELAAARTTLFSPEQLLERLSQRLDLFKGGRDADPRQQTLRATIEWSYNLLAPEEQRLFRCLSVFPGGCTYEAAEEVCGADPDTLQSLLDKSLLRRRESTFGSRYWMLETIREYSTERLEDAGDTSALLGRHAEWCCELAERLTTLPGHMRALEIDIEEGFARLQDERENLQSALSWAWSSNQNELGLRLGIACCPFWVERDGFYDAVAWLEVATPRIPLVLPRVQLPALEVAGLTAFHVITTLNWLIATGQALKPLRSSWARPMRSPGSRAGAQRSSGSEGTSRRLLCWPSAA